MRDNRQMVDESATAPKEQSQFVKDRAAARKVNSGRSEVGLKRKGRQVQTAF